MTGMGKQASSGMTAEQIATYLQRIGFTSFRTSFRSSFHGSFRGSFSYPLSLSSGSMVGGFLGYGLDLIWSDEDEE